MFECNEYKLESIPVRINKKIKEALDIYYKMHIPRCQLMEDFLAVKSKNHLIDAVPINTWKYLHKKDGAESGVSLLESAFTFGAMKLVDEDATDVIRAAYYSSRNDSGIECSLLLMEYLRMIDDTEDSLIINPSPDMILLFEERRKGKGKNCYCVIDHTIAELYRIQFPKSWFFCFEEESKMQFDKMLFINRDSDKTYFLIKWIQYCKGDVLAELPNAFIEKRKNELYEILQQTYHQIDSVTILPREATNTCPRKKSIVSLKYTKDNNEKLKLLNSTFDKNNKIIKIIDEGFVLDKSNFLRKQYTLLNLWNQEIEGGIEEKSKYEEAKKYDFSKEIQLWYSIYEGRKNRYAGKCWYKHLKSIAPLCYGKRASKIIEKGLRADCEEEVVKKIWKIVFDERVYPYIYTDIKECFLGNNIEITLKTMWVICRNIMISSAVYDEMVFMELFAQDSKGISSYMVSEHTDKDIVAALAQRLQVRVDEIPQNYLIQLNLLFDVAKREKIINYNPLAELFISIKRRASERQQDIRQVLAKKSFSDREEEKIFNYSIQQVWSEIANEEIPRCIAKSLALGGLIRLFTGISLREVCALQWKDLVQIDETDEYQINITKFIDMKGKITTHAQKEDWKKFRCVAVPTPLKILLEMRKSYLREIGIDEEVIRESPIVLSNEEIKSLRKGGRSLFCKPGKVQEYCRKLLAQAEIPEQWLILPDANGEMETDIYKYHGDIFVSNLKKQLNHVCGFTNGEISYLLGLAAQDTFSRHYCDYSNELILYGMVKKMNRWTGKYEMILLGENDSIPDRGDICAERIEIKSGLYANRCASTELIINSQKMEEANLKISIECKHGSAIDIIKYRS